MARFISQRPNIGLVAQRPWKILTYAALLSAAAVILFLIATAQDPLRYHGHPLVYWLKEHRKATANFRDSEAQAQTHSAQAPPPHIET
jgi:hypothetical protein